MRQADSIRTFVLENYIELARSRGERFVTIRAGDVGKELRLQDRMPAIGGALRARKFEWRANAILVDEYGPRQGSNLYLTFAILRPDEVPLEDLMEGPRIADRVTNHVMERFVRPARTREDSVITLRVVDVHDATGLMNLHDVVGAVLKGRRFQARSRVRVVGVEGIDSSQYLRLRLAVLSAEEPIAAPPPEGPCALIRTTWAGRRPATFQRMEQRVKKLVSDFDRYILEFDNASLFTGPSLYFHLKTIAVLRRHGVATDALEDDEFWDLLYATLTSWGLHRLGNQAAKLVEVDEMRQSFLAQRHAIERLQELGLSELSDADLRQVTRSLWSVMEKLTVGRQEVKLIANSKALHHVLPDIVPPIDREYVLRFFYHNKNVSPGDGREFREIYPVFHHIARETRSSFPPLLGKGMHTSETKIIDNAIVGFVLAELS